MYRSSILRPRLIAVIAALAVAFAGLGLPTAAKATMFLVRKDATHGTTVTVVEGTVRNR
jgi:hypothetical protein